jgi:hypothetical protein
MRGDSGEDAAPSAVIDARRRRRAAMQASAVCRATTFWGGDMVGYGLELDALGAQRDRIRGDGRRRAATAQRGHARDVWPRP